MARMKTKQAREIVKEVESRLRREHPEWHDHVSAAPLSGPALWEEIQRDPVYREAMETLLHYGRNENRLSAKELSLEEWAERQQ